ncbi:MAG: hypothetical protein OEL87_02705 [Nanoarchaeota archaeon]|nr:hypothetical protein [Nanoarchaeota archaeon]
MKIQDLVEELQEKQSYQNFKVENPSAFFAAGFFILDVKETQEQIQLDFFLPEKERIAAFEFPFTEAKIFDEKVNPMSPQTTDIKIDLDDIGPISKEIIKENGSAIIPTKIIAILKDNQWNLTCMDDMLGMVRIKLDALTGKKIDFSKGSLMDFMGIKKK